MIRHQRRLGGRFSVIGRGLLALLLIAIALSGLAALAGPRASAQDDASGTSTRVRFLHADTDESKLEVHLNGDEVLDEFTFGSLSDWIDLDPGSVRVTITEDRAGFNYAIFDATYPVPAGNDYLVIISDALVLSSVVDRSPIVGDQARVQIVHASVDLPEVNVIAAGTDTNLASQLSYSQASNYVEVPAGSFDVEVRVASSGETAFTQTGIAVEAGMVYSLVIVGSPDDEDHPLSIIAVDDQTVERDRGTPTA
jgi:hypothetical protein